MNIYQSLVLNLPDHYFFFCVLLFSWVVYFLFKKVFFKKTDWAILPWKNWQGTLGFIIFVFLIYFISEHYIKDRYLISDTENYLRPKGFLSFFLRMSGIVAAIATKFVYMVKKYKKDSNRKKARVALIIPPIFLAYLSAENYVAQVPSNELLPMWFWVALISLDIVFFFYSKKWPQKKEVPKGWFKRKFFKAKIAIKGLSFVLLVLLYLITMFGEPVSSGFRNERIEDFYTTEDTTMKEKEIPIKGVRPQPKIRTRHNRMPKQNRTVVNHIDNANEPVYSKAHF